MFRDSRWRQFVTVLLAVGAFGALLTAQDGMQREGRGGPRAKATPGFVSGAGRARTGRAPSASKEREAGASTV